MAGTVIDVRTPAEFMGGHVVGSINIPLQEILEHVEEIKKMGYEPYIIKDMGSYNPEFVKQEFEVLKNYLKKI